MYFLCFVSSHLISSCGFLVIWLSENGGGDQSSEGYDKYQNEIKAWGVFPVEANLCNGNGY